VAELVLQILDAHRDRRLRPAEPGARRGEAAGLRHGHQHAERGEVEMSGHDVPPRDIRDRSVLRMVKSE
jgi:hypothetical protein